ncbi:MAG: hypothetical protein Kow0031_13130 [Anaerolineae bacterium]
MQIKNPANPGWRVGERGKGHHAKRPHNSGQGQAKMLPANFKNHNVRPVFYGRRKRIWVRIGPGSAGPG